MSNGNLLRFISRLALTALALACVSGLQAQTNFAVGTKVWFEANSSAASPTMWAEAEFQNSSAATRFFENR